MRRIRKKFRKPFRPWDKERIEEEKVLLKTYGLKEKREIWKAESILRSLRRRARTLAAEKNEEQIKILLDKLRKLGLIDKKSDLTDVLGLTVENILERRLQTLVFRRKLANTPKHARQMITHGHIAIDNRRMSYPSYLVPKEMETKIGFYKSQSK